MFSITSKNVKKWIHITKYQVMKNLINYFSMEVITLSSSGNQALLEELRKFINIKNKHENRQQCQELQIIIDST